MFVKQKPLGLISKRLLPLYWAAFFQGFVLWYTIEKLFMTSIGFTAATIGLMASAYSVMMIMMETPSGILADRWSRRGILVLGSIALTIAALICGLSHSVGIYIVGATFWGVFYAFYSGTYDSIVYDTMLEETGKSDGYEKYYGRVQVFESAGLVLGSLLGGVVGSMFGLRSAFLWSIVPALSSIVFLMLFKEPKLHKAEPAKPVFAHIKNTFSSVLKGGSLMSVLIILVLGTTLAEMVMEFGQFWYIALSVPVVLYGPANAFLLSTFGAAGLLATKLRMNHKYFVLLFVAALLGAGLTLIFARTLWLIVPAQSVISLALVCIEILYLRQLHDRLPSNVRAGASSAISTMGRGIFIIAALGFGWVTLHTSVFVASWIIFIPLVVISIFLYGSINPRIKMPANPAKLALDSYQK